MNLVTQMNQYKIFSWEKYFCVYEDNIFRSVFVYRSTAEKYIRSMLAKKMKYHDYA